MDQIPKPLLVAVIFILGIVGIRYAIPEYTQCNAQIEILQKNLAGVIFPSKGKKMTFSPKVVGYLESCKVGNGPGGCYELLAAMNRLTRETRNFSSECAAQVGEVAEVKRAITETLSLMVRLAWGPQPPEAAEKRAGWFESGDLVTFCQIRQAFELFYGREVYEQFRNGLLASLPGEAPQFEEGKCSNCEFRKAAKDVLEPDELLKRSLFSLSCGSYR